MFNSSLKSRKLIILSAAPVIAISALTFCKTNAESAKLAPAEENANSDVKPPLTNDALDEEQMRLAKIIHKRITDCEEIKDKTNAIEPQPFAAYEDKLISGAKFEMLPVKGGTFTWKGKEESDTLEVTLSPFWMGKAEVTWDEYDPFMNNEVPREKDGQVVEFARTLITNDIDFLARPTVPYHPMTFGMGRDGYPAIGMTQHAANKFCQWISYQTGHFYRLPTEAEWEYACRAGSKTNFAWGDKPEEAEQYAWFGGDDASHYQKSGQKKPNAWGLMEMHGNALEWTLDQYVPNRRAYFGKDKVTNPWIKATNPYPHVTKGGHWKQKLEEVSASSRIPSKPEWKLIDPQEPKSLWYFTDVKMLGFRIVRPKEIPTAEEMYHYWNSGVSEDGKLAVYLSDYRAESKTHEIKEKKEKKEE